MFGQAFKQLRRSKHLSLKECATASVSPASLSRFESGKQDLGIEKLAALLAKIESSMTELQSLAALTEAPPLPLSARVANLVAEQDAEALLAAYQERADRYALHATQHLFWERATVANGYCQLTGQPLLTSRELLHLGDSVMSITAWTPASLEVFAASLYLLAADQVRRLAVQLAQAMPELAGHTGVYLQAWRVSLDALAALLVRDPDAAAAVADAQEQVPLPANALQITLRHYFPGIILSNGKNAKSPCGALLRVHGCFTNE